MLFKNIDVLDENLEHHSGWYVGVKDGLVAYMGADKPEEDFGDVYDGTRKLLMPGLVNTHAHAPMTLLRGYAENLPLDRWLFESVFPFEAKITDEYARPATDLAIAEMLRFGTVSFSDMYFFDDERAASVIESGIKCNLCMSISVFDPEIEYRDTPFYDKNKYLLSTYQGAADGRLVVDLCLHSEYTTTEKVVRGLADHAREAGTIIQVHVSETSKEHEECKERHGGLTPVAHFEKCGVLDSPVVAAHCVWVTPEDMDILAAHDATVASNPASNFKLGSGICDIRGLTEHGVRVALGTDGVASNNATNMFRDLYLLAIAQKGITHDPEGISVTDILRAATISGAEAQGRKGCGALKVGNRADLIVLDLDVPQLQPVTDIRNNIVYSATGSEVVLTMVDGRVLYRDGEYLTIDIERAMYDTQRARDEIVASL